MDTLGNIETAGNLGVGTSKPFQISTTATIYNATRNVGLIVLSTPTTILYVHPYVTVGAYNSSYNSG